MEIFDLTEKKFEMLIRIFHSFLNRRINITMNRYESLADSLVIFDIYIYIYIYICLCVCVCVCVVGQQYFI